MTGRGKNFIEELYVCARCGYCRSECPATHFFGFETYSARGKILVLKHIIEKSLGFKEDLMKNYFTCSLCSYCKSICPLEIDLMDLFVHVRSKLVENSLVPARIKEVLENIYKYGNAWGLPRTKRSEWATDLEIKQYESGQDFLYYVGDVGSYDPRAREAARALARILSKSGMSFGILGSRENCSGSEAFEIGEIGLLELLATSNIELFKELGVRNIVCLSPHSYNVIKNIYPRFSGAFNVMHYTQLLKRLIDEGKLILRGYEKKKTITYHDPCFLGRWNREYEAPRKILEAIPNVEFVEMERNKENSFCCGGGSGGYYSGFGSGLFSEAKNSPNRIRVREAFESGAEILAVSCPSCLIMFEDAIKVEELEGKMIVKDISEIIYEVMAKNHSF
jgi:Fe-S oxidoreductase